MTGWIRKLFGAKRAKPASDKSERQLVPGRYQEPRSAKLLKEATKLKNSGKLDEAIGILRKAYREIEREGGGHTMPTYLRLPMLLQQAGRPNEAWEEYNRLLRSDPTGIGVSRELRPMHHSQVYDKMRLFLQREGEMEMAIGYGLMSSVSSALGLHNQNRMAELKLMMEDANLERVIMPLLRKAKRPDVAPVLIKVLRISLEQVPKVDLQGMASEVQKALQEPS